MVRLLEVRYCKQSDVTFILRQFNGKFEDSSSTDSVMRSVKSSSKIHLSVCLFACMSVCLSVSLTQTHIALCLNITFSDRDVKTIQIGKHKENMR